MTVEVRAAGGVVSRRGADGRLELLLVHRPRYDDWSFPKGKNLPGEGDEDCALREVEEETGLRCALGAELPSVSYTDRRGRPKVVRYWEMELRSGELRANDEVDEAAWLSLSEAEARLSHEHDRALLSALGAGP